VNVAKKSRTNVIDDPTQTLQTFDLLDLQEYTREKTYSNNTSKDFHLFYAGRDDVHGVLKHVLSRVSVSLYMNMFGYDDEELQRHHHEAHPRSRRHGAGDARQEPVLRQAREGDPRRGPQEGPRQNNTQTVFTDPDAVRFQTELIAEHLAALKHAGEVATNAKPAREPQPA